MGRGFNGMHLGYAMLAGMVGMFSVDTDPLFYEFFFSASTLHEIILHELSEAMTFTRDAVAECLSSYSIALHIALVSHFPLHKWPLQQALLNQLPLPSVSHSSVSV